MATTHAQEMKNKEKELMEMVGRKLNTEEGKETKRSTDVAEKREALHSDDPAIFK